VTSGNTNPNFAKNIKLNFKKGQQKQKANKKYISPKNNLENISSKSSFFSEDDSPKKSKKVVELNLDILL
jgi:hypothetical protein